MNGKLHWSVSKRSFVFPDDVTEGDALITFTKRAVLDIAGRLEREGIRASVIYGSLPPEIRRRQIRLFLSHETKVVVSTDAIGMGLNLPVRRIVFIQTEKYDAFPPARLIFRRYGRLPDVPDGLACMTPVMSMPWARMPEIILPNVLTSRNRLLRR